MFEHLEICVVEVKLIMLRHGDRDDPGPSRAINRHSLSVCGLER